MSEYGGDLIVATLCLVETSRFGLLETELLELLAIQPTVLGAKTNEDLAVDGKLPMAKVPFIPFHSEYLSHFILDAYVCTV